MMPTMHHRLEHGAQTADLLDLARDALRRAAADNAAEGIPATTGGGMLRPLVSMAGLDAPEDPPPGFWDAVLAIQLAHEASLIHDDVIDGSDERRGEPTARALRGVPLAVLEGDHLLTASYRAAARSRNIDFVTLFARAVERTVALESEQARIGAGPVEFARYREIALGKSGELFGCALAAAPVLTARLDAANLFEIGRRVGLIYQMVDDLFDYCPSANTGKPPLQDFVARRWTWVVEEIPGFGFGLDPSEVVDRLHRLDAHGGGATRAVARIAQEATDVTRIIHGRVPGDRLVISLLNDWVSRAHAVIAQEAAVRQRHAAISVPAHPSSARTERGGHGIDESGRDGDRQADPQVHEPPSSVAGAASTRHAASPSTEAITSRTDMRPSTDRPPSGRKSRGRRKKSARSRVSAAIRNRVPDNDAVEEFLGIHSRSFRLATRFFPPGDAERVARVYAYCRVVDNLVDQPIVGIDPEEILDEWLWLSTQAFEGRSTGVELLDRVMTEMSEGGVPFDYASELVEGMRMDLRRERYESVEALRTYTYRVASVVGLWLARLYGVTDPVLLERAERMGHAMQLTNILRDVGEDWWRGRLYLPADRMRAHGVGEDTIHRMIDDGYIRRSYRRLLRELMEIADSDYASAIEVLPAVPRTFARPSAVAAYVYRGIHREIRRNGYDNLRKRAHTNWFKKAVLTGKALRDFERARSRFATVPVVRVTEDAARTV